MMMNGVLMSNGIDAISIPHHVRKNSMKKWLISMLNVMQQEMMSFLVDCHPDASLMLTTSDENKKNEHPSVSDATDRIIATRSDNLIKQDKKPKP